MSFLGYHVGSTAGLTEKARKIIIDRVMTKQLPFYWSPTYMLEWGEPNTKARFTKLENFFKGMVGAKNYRNMDLARDQWLKDLAYLRDEYGSDFKNS